MQEYKANQKELRVKVTDIKEGLENSYILQSIFTTLINFDT